VFAFVIAFTIGFFAIWRHVTKTLVETEDSYFKEFFSGLKHGNISRLYFSVFILRRLFRVIIIIPGESIPMIIRVIIYLRCIA
jgi:hypothetical protein